VAESILELNIYPNPNGGQFHIEKQITAAIQIQLFDCWGRELLTRELHALVEEIQMEDLPDGVYYLKVQGESNQIVKKIIKSN